jgi:eukaryotic-like serine/threonine-protein kinase
MANEQQDTVSAPTIPSGNHSMPSQEFGVLPVLAVGERGSGAELELGETIGAGGMGQVVSGRQVSLDRPVALKFLRDARGDPAALLREAIVTGQLEHPNIVPVHLLGQTHDGAPFFTMKRVEGKPWSEALTEHRPLVEHLETFVRVCDAVAFAHDRGVLHRDIKPDNVMLGRFGVVYLVDWGLAVALKGNLILPLASEAGVAGTPAYMAPEMAAGTPLTAQSDIYLLGATLYEVLTGRFPHRASTPAGVIAEALSGAPPDFEPTVASELQAICRRAMAKHPQDRYGSAVELRDAVVEYLRHREALVLHEHAQRLLVALEASTSMTPSMTTSVMGLQAHVVFAECRAAFDQVRRMWPEFREARVGQQRAIMRMVRYELSRNEARAARILLTQLEDAPDELRREVEAAEQAQALRDARFVELERRERDGDINVSLIPKSVSAFAFGLFALGCGVALQAVIASGTVVITAWHGVFLFGSSILTTEAFSFVLSRSRPANRAESQLKLVLRVSAWSAVLYWVGAAVLTAPLDSTFCGYLIFVGSHWVVAGAIWEQRGWVVGLALSVGAFAGIALPSLNFALGGVAAFVGFSLLGWSLRQSERGR